MYQLHYSPSFWKAYNSLTKGNILLKKRIVKTLRLLENNPHHPSLKSHKAVTREFGKRWSARVTGDIRIMWDFDREQTLCILILTIGSHTGKKKVYQ